ncbi:MAG: NAD(P)H-binding protein [Gemmatirosa sp.]
MIPDPAFVAGATGYVGRALVRVLADGGARVHAHVRPDSPQLAEWRARFAALRATADATPWDEDAMTDTLVALRPAAVFALLGTTRKRVRAIEARGGRESYETVDYGLTALLLRATQRAARETGTTPRFVYLSSVGADAASRNPYVAVRGRIEQELRTAGLPWTVARPSFITGPDREESRPAERIGAAVVDAALALPGLLGAHRLRDRWRSTSADELAGALARLAADAAAAGRVVEGEGLR